MRDEKLQLQYGMSLTDESRDMLGDTIRAFFLSQVGLPRMPKDHKTLLAQLIEDAFPEQTLEDIRARIEKKDKNPLLIANLPELDETELPRMDLRNELFRSGVGPEPSDLMTGFIMEGLMQHFDMHVRQRISRGRTFLTHDPDNPDGRPVIESLGEKYSVVVPGGFKHKESPAAEDLLIMLATPRNQEQAGTHFYDLPAAIKGLTKDEAKGVRLYPVRAKQEDDKDVPLAQALRFPERFTTLKIAEDKSNPEALKAFDQQLEENKVSHVLQRGEMLLWNDGQIYHSADLGQPIQDYTRARLLVHFNGMQLGG